MTTKERNTLEEHADELHDAAMSWPLGNAYRTALERTVDALRAALRETRETPDPKPWGHPGGRS